MEFADTNVLLYAYDPAAGERHAKAQGLIDRLWDSATGAISVQVLQEFYVNVTHKLEIPLDPDGAVERLIAFSRWRVHAPLADDVVAAARWSDQYQLSFWDAMILRSASELECRTLWSEDLNDGQTIEGVTIRNPFA